MSAWVVLMTHCTNWSKLSHVVLTVQSCNTRLLLLLRLKARGAGTARPECTSWLLGRTALSSCSPWTTSCEPAEGKQCRQVVKQGRYVGAQGRQAEQGGGQAGQVGR